MTSSPNSTPAIARNLPGKINNYCTRDHMKTAFSVILIATLLGISGGCSQQPASQSASTPELLAVATTSPITTEIAGQLLGKADDVRLIVPRERPS
ncbi:MAG: hypothetical protein ACKPJJ_02240, partial [Planctomycetaceae bacterium]